MLGFASYLTLYDTIFLVLQRRKLYVSTLSKVTEQPCQNLGCPKPVAVPSATRRVGKGGSQWAGQLFSILCDTSTELGGKEEGHKTHLVEQPQRFSEAL